MKIRKRYILNSLIVGALLVFAFSAKDLFGYLFSREKKTIEYGTQKNQEIKSNLDSLTVLIENEMDSLSSFLVNNQPSVSSIENTLEICTKKFSSCLGTTVAFEVNKSWTGDSLLSVYYDKSKDSTLRIDKIYNYTDKALKTAVWYTGVVKKKAGIWSEPYYAKAAKKLVVDYGHPILKNGELIGIVSYTISLKSFSDYLKKLSVGVAGYGIITNDSVLISHPKIDRVLNKELSKKRLKENPDFRQMRENESGHFEFFSNYTFEESSLFYSRMKNGWILGLAINEHDILQGDGQFVQKVIKLTTSLSFLFVLIILFYSLIKGIRNRHVWQISFLLAVLVVFNIILFWYLKYNFNAQSVLNNRLKIVNKNILNNLLEERNERLSQLQIEPAIQIPTGIQINEIDFQGAYDVALCGEIWQKIPNDFDVKEKTFDFPQKTPQGLAVRTNLLSKVKYEDYILYKYEFVAKLQIDFNYTSFPLDFRVINMQLRYPYSEQNVILIPDIESYNILDPSTKPGISHYINVPSAEITSSFFSLFKYQNKTDLSARAKKGLNDSLHLEFDVLVKRNILNPVITNILPILVIAVLIFLFPFTIQKKKGELVEGSALSIIQASGGFFFILVLAHIQLRKNIMAPEILYLETFYIIMYIIIAVIATLILMIVKTNKYQLLERDNNFAIKVAYWPFLLLLTLISSYIFLY